MQHLYDWPGLLLKFRKTFIRSESKTQSSSSTSEPTLRLMRLLSTNVARSAANSVEGNFIVSAMHLAYLITARTTEEVVPDLPDSYDGLASAYVPSHCTCLSLICPCSHFFCPLVCLKKVSAYPMLVVPIQTMRSESRKLFKL